MHYRDATIFYEADKYAIKVEDHTILVKSYNSKYYICKTCHKKLLKGNVPCQASWNKLRVYTQPEQLSCLNKLERVIISKRMLFSKVMIMPKGQMPKIKGAICNVPIDVGEVTKILPRGADSNGIITVKLKRKLAYNGHAHFQAIRPEDVQAALEFLKANIYIYIYEESEPTEINNIEENENPLDKMRIGSSETVLVSNIPHVLDEETVTIAPGEGKKPLSILMDKQCEELAFPHLFPQGKFGYNIDRDVSLSASKYFNQRLLNYTQRFASDTDYIFFAHSVLQQMQLSSQINIALKKVKGHNLTTQFYTYCTIFLVAAVQF